MTDRFAMALPFGAEPRPDGATRFRLWAPSAAHVSLEIAGQAPVAMQPEPGGWFSATAPAPPGSRYAYRLPRGLRVPDPASRAQAGDVHDESLVVDPRAYQWQHADWQGRPWHEAVISELHVGALGGFDGVRARLPRLRDLGFTAIELMPVADFPGPRNWGYDGVLPFAPDAAYGPPEALKALIDAAHGLGLMVLLDVVYNHFGPDGNYLHAYAAPFFRDDIETPWGAAIDFRRHEVRDFFIVNAHYWLEEYRFDGLRFDAVHAISEPDFLDEMAAAIRAATGPSRHVHLVLEHEGNAAHHLRQTPDGSGFDAQWADDFHHCLHVLLTGETEGYYEDFREPTRLLARCLAEGFAYQGEISPHSGQPRGEPSAHLPSTDFVVCLQNHDQIGNRALGERLTTLAKPDALHAATVLLLLAPFVPLVFMGEEWGTARPFLYFTSHEETLAKLVRDGRRAEFRHFAAFQDPHRREQIPDPNAPGTFAASIPDDADSAIARRYAELLELRRDYVIPGIPGCRSEGVEVLGKAAVLARWRLGNAALLTIALNLGPEPASAATAHGQRLYATGEAGEVLRGGVLPARSAVALLEPPR